jgi:aryl-alcohol dehydrogenase-like predicted oxidoreductase
MQTRTIGPVTVSAIGLGGMPMSSEGELEHCAAAGIAFLPWSPLGGIGRAGQPARGLRRDRRGTRDLTAAGDARVVAGQGTSGHPDPRRKPPRVDHRLRAGPELTPEEFARLDG